MNFYAYAGKLFNISFLLLDDPTARNRVSHIPRLIRAGWMNPHFEKVVPHRLTLFSTEAAVSHGQPLMIFC